MTFEIWYEAVENKSYLNLSLQEKNSLEYKFLGYLRKHPKAEVADRHSNDELGLLFSTQDCAFA